MAVTGRLENEASSERDDRRARLVLWVDGVLREGGAMEELYRFQFHVRLDFDFPGSMLIATSGVLLP